MMCIYTYAKKKESIQLQVPLQLPCYDFTTIIDNTVKISTQRKGTDIFITSVAYTMYRRVFLSTAHFHSVTGGVYKA